MRAITQTRARPDQITGLLLAGGRARRMAAADKGLIEFAGRALVDHAIALLEPQVGHMLISANRNHREYARRGHEVIADEQTGYPGPLAGIAAGLRHMNTPWLLCIPCDMPLLPPDLGARLAECAAASSRPGCVVSTPEGIQPLCALLHSDLRESLERFIADGGRSARDWVQRAGLGHVDYSHASERFINLNTRADIAHLEAQLHNMSNNG